MTRREKRGEGAINKYSIKNTLEARESLILNTDYAMQRVAKQPDCDQLLLFSRFSMCVMIPISFKKLSVLYLQCRCFLTRQ